MYLLYRRTRIFLASITFFVLFFSLYSQYVLGLQPCPLCIMQRICVFLLMLVMALSCFTIKKARLFSLLQIICSVAGLFFSSRHLWLQSLPADAVPACMPGLDILISYFPWQEVARALFWGAGDCAEKTWSFLGVSMPGWSALYFLCMMLSGLFLYTRPRSS